MTINFQLMDNFSPTNRTQLHRIPQRATYEVSKIYGILDEALVCHVGFIVDNAPIVLPTTYARIANQVYLHGAQASRMLKSLKEGIQISMTVTLLDGLVFARSAFHHSMNYRSVVILGQAVEVTDLSEKQAALEAIVNHMQAGRMEHTRAPNPKELRATMVLRLELNEVSAKVRTGPPVDDEEDLSLPYWAGVVPVRLQAEQLQPAPGLSQHAQSLGIIPFSSNER
jgi:uncharacterized protein